jgi:hypothetical protein
MKSLCVNDSWLIAAKPGHRYYYALLSQLQHHILNGLMQNEGH